MHRIRLRHPWEKRITGVAEATRVAVPEPAVDESARETPPRDSAAEKTTATYCRSFHRPTGLDPSSRVTLRISEWRGRLESLQLNDHPLPCPAGPPVEIDVTASLGGRNRLQVVLAPESDTAAGLSGEVELMIEESPPSHDTV